MFLLVVSGVETPLHNFPKKFICVAQAYRFSCKNIENGKYKITLNLKQEKSDYVTDFIGRIAESRWGELLCSVWCP